MMKTPELLLAGCLLLAAPFARAQEGAASGTITDSHGEAVAYCTVSLRRTADSTVVTGVVSDTLGRYRLAPLSGESCFLEFAHVAYETASRAVPPGRTAFVCDVVLQPVNNRIDEVTVLSRFVERRAGRYTVSLVGNPLARDRLLNDLLVLLPGMRQEQNRTFKINGREIRQIYIDDRPATADELKALPAESVKTVEIQRFASSDQEIAARGAVLRITLRPLADGGYRGTAMSWLCMRDNGFSNTGFQFPLTMRYGRFNLYNQLSYSYFEELHEYTRQADYDDEALAIRSTETERTDHHTFTDRLNLVWEVTPHHRLGLTGGFSYASSVPDLVSSSLHYPSGSSLPAAGSSFASHGELDNHIWQATASYRWLRDEEGSQLKADFDYVDFASDKRYCYDEQTEGAPSAVTTESQHPRNRLFLAETSFTEVLNERLTLQAGGEYYWRDIRRRTLTAEDGSPSGLSTFRYRGNGAAVYGDAELSLDWFELVGGVRMQWDRVDHFTGGDTRWRRRDYWRLCPNVNASFILEQERGTTLDLAYTRDGSYIPYDMLSPLRIRESEFRYTVGNPELTPSRGYDLDAVLTLRERWTLSYTYSRGEEMIERMTFTDPDDPQQSYEQPVNCSTMGKHMLSLSYAGPLTKWWRVNWELYGTRGFYRYAGITHRVQSSGIYLSNSLQFAPGFGMTVQFSLESPYEHPGRRHNAMHNLGATLYKYLCKNRLYLNLEARCLLQNDNVNWMWSVSDGYRSYQRHRSRRSFIFTVAYFFNNYKGKRGIQRTQTLQKITYEYR